MSIDYDPGASEVNQLNRIKLMVATAHSNHEPPEARDPEMADQIAEFQRRLEEARPSGIKSPIDLEPGDLEDERPLERTSR